MLEEFLHKNVITFDEEEKSQKGKTKKLIQSSEPKKQQENIVPKSDGLNKKAEMVKHAQVNEQGKKSRKPPKKPEQPPNNAQSKPSQVEKKQP